MKAEDFDLRRVFSAAYPWAIVFRETGQYLATPAVFDTWGGAVSTTVIGHRLKRDARAALDQFLAAPTPEARPS